jgi:hypothetical protein
VVCLFIKPLVAILGYVLLYLAALQMAAFAPIQLSFQLENFYYSQSSIRIDYNLMDEIADSLTIIV